MLAFYIAALVLLFTSRSDNFGLYRSVGVNALTLDTHTSQIWEDGSSMINRIAQQSLCTDGSAPKLERIQLDGEVTAYELQCDEVPRNNTSADIGELHKRQATSLCPSTCNHDCYRNTYQYTPESNDCSVLSARLRSWNSNQSVSAGKRVVLQWQTCVYMLTNKRADTLNFCDSAWAAISDTILSRCPLSPSDPKRGGICSTVDFYIEAVGALYVPQPSPTSTSTTTRSSSSSSTASDGASQTSSTSQSGSSSTTTGPTSSASGSSNSSSTVSGSTPSIASYQTLGDPPNGIEAATGSMPESSITAADDNAQSHETRKTDIAAIVGGTVGGVAAVAFLVAVFFIMRRVKQYEEMRSEKGDQYVSSPYITSRPPSSSSPSDPDPLQIPVYNAFTEAQSPKTAMTREFGSTWAAHATSHALSAREEHPATPTRSDTTRSTFIHPSGTERDSSEEVPSQDSAVAGPTVEALIAAAAPADMPQAQVNLLAANFMSLMRGHRPMSDGAQEDESVREVRLPPPYQ